MKKRIGQGLMIVGLMAALVGGVTVWKQLGHAPAPLLPPSVGAISGTFVNDEKPLPAFSLVRGAGTFSNADLAGRWSMVFFGYTQCPDVCPTALTLMKDVKARLAQQNEVTPPQVVFISVDPKRDSPELLAQFTGAFDPYFVGVTGSDDALKPLAKSLGVFYQRNDAKDPKHYTVDHSAAIYLIGPRGNLVAVFSPPQNAEKITRDYIGLAKALLPS